MDPEKTALIIFGSHDQLKNLDSYLPIRIFGKLLHPSAVVKNLVVWFDASFPLLIMSAIFVRSAPFKSVISDRSDSS